MENPIKPIGVLLVLGFFMTFTSAANFTCPPAPVNETALCGTVPLLINVTNVCTPEFRDYACSDSAFLANVSDNLLVNLSSCYSNDTILALDPAYATLLFIKLNSSRTSTMFDKLNNQFSSLKPEWRKFLLDGIWPQLTKNLSNVVPATQWIPTNVQPFLVHINPDMVQCLPQQNANCGVFQELVRNLDMIFPNLTDAAKKQLFPPLKSFLNNQKNVTGLACSQNTNSSMWIKQNFGQFSKFADFSDFTSIFANFSALDALPLLSIPQIASFSVDFNPANNSAAIGNILAALTNTNAVTEFLSSLNAAAGLKNINSLPPALAQGFLNKTFGVLKDSFSGYNLSDWTKLFQNQLSLMLPEITADQLSLISPNISCDSFQAVLKSLDMKYQKMSLGKPEAIYNSFIKPFLSKQGPACSQNFNSTTLISQYFGQFSMFANYSDFLALNVNFSALDVLQSLTISQKIGFTFAKNFTDAAGIVGSLQNANDVQDFLNQFNAAAIMKNLNAVPAPLSQALLNKTFVLLLANVSALNNSDWIQLFQNKIPLFLPEITAQQLGVIPQNIPCDAYKAIVGSLDVNFQKMTPGNQEAIFKTLIQPYVKKQGPACSQMGNSLAVLKQNFGQFSKYASFADLSGLGGNFKALDVLPLLTLPQLVDFTVNTTINPNIASAIVANLKTPTDVYTFLSSFKTAMSPKNQTSVDPALSKALLTQTFQVLQPTFNNFNTSNWSQLFQEQIIDYLPMIMPDQLLLIPKNITCDSYHVIVKAMDSTFSQMTTANQQSVYQNFIKPYVARKDKPSNVVICYNQSDVNSSTWLVTNMASFMTYTSEEDLTLCASTATLQSFASDPSSMKLASQLKLTKDAGLYYTSLLTLNPNISISGLPVAFLCFLNPDALKRLTGDEALALTPKINKQCFNKTSGQASTTPSSTDLQVATSIASKLTNFSADNLINLGQSAVGLSTGQINMISGKDLQSSVTSLATVSGWNNGQTRSIMTKLLSSNYTIASLTDLGSLVTGLPSKTLQTLSQSAILSAAKDAQFVSKLSSAPPSLQGQFVQQIIMGDTNASNLVNNVPASMVSFIPPSKLFSKSVKLTLNDVNGKSWTASQAAIFFDDLLLTTANYTDMSASVMQGFTCVTPSKIDNNQLRKLAKAMKTQGVAPSEDQLTCLSRQVVKSGYPSDLDQYPKEMFLYLNATMYSISANATCKDFFTNVGAANISVLQKGASLRSGLLSQALTCLNVTGYALTSAHTPVLGQLICDLNGTYIDNSYPDLVYSMAVCKSFTSDQQTSILKVLSKGSSSFGSPSSWTKDTLNSLGAMSGFLSKDILVNITTASLNSWLTDAIPNKLLTRTQFVTIIQNLIGSTRARRAVGCTTGTITAADVNNDLLPLKYTAAQLDACLDNDTLVNYLDVLTAKPFTTEQIYVLKNKLDVNYPSGYPETILPSLGAIIFQCTDSDINKWNITSVDTLQGLLSSGPTANVTKSVLTKYLNSGNSLTSNAINIVGSNICVLTSAQVDTINSTALGEAKPLDISTCSQTLKDSLYSKAKTYSEGVTSDTSGYYNLIKPYLGGASLADLKTLASKSPNMDIGTFVTLNPSVVVGLTVSDVKTLLGNNTADLTSQISNPVVNAWVSSQKQSDLDTLGLGIQGGIRDTATSATTTVTTKPSSSAPASTQGMSFILVIVAAIFLL